MPLCKLLLMLMMLHLTYGCFSPYHFKYASNTQTKFHYTFTAEPCGDFVFEKCTWQTCWNRRGKKCIEWHYHENTNWDECTQEFCQPGVTYRQTYDSIGECEQYQYRTIRAFELAMGLGLGLGVPAFCCLAIWLKLCSEGSKAQSCQKQCCCCCENQQEQQEQPTSQQPKVRVTQRVSFPPPITAKKMYLQPLDHTNLPQKSEKMVDLENEECAVCLLGNTRLELSCFHRYHRRCIAEYLLRKRQCPVCRQTQLQVARSACQECGRGAYRINLSKGDALSQPILCDKCMRK